jgi:methionyl-tRNA formyltransferase
MTLVFLGSGHFAVPALEMLVRSPHRPVLVVTRPDRPAGRGRKVIPTPVRARARELDLHEEAPPSVNAPEFTSRLAEISPDLALVADYGEILRPPFLAVPRLGTFNLHGSLLPRHRGAAPVPAAIVAGDAVTGVTLFRIEEGLDSGPVVDRSSAPILPLDTAGELEARLAVLAAELLEKNLPLLAAGNFKEEPQDERQATRAPKLSPEAGRIDWSLPAGELARLIRALSPRPGAHALLRRSAGAQPERVRLLLAREAPPAEPASGVPPGTVTRVEKHGFRVCAGGGEVEILRLQPAGRSVLTASEFLRGYALASGDRFEEVDS